MTTCRVWLSRCACALLTMYSYAAFAAPVVQPAGLEPGDTYRLMFVTSATLTPGGWTPADLNNFAMAAANSVPELAELDLDWFAIARFSYQSEYANVGPASNAPIYNLQGELVQTDVMQLLNTLTVVNPVQYNEWGNQNASPYVMTGIGNCCSLAGPMDSNNPSLGVSNVGWIRWAHAATTLTDGAYSIYALSSELQVPQLAPNPGSGLGSGSGTGSGSGPGTGPIGTDPITDPQNEIPEPSTALSALGGMLLVAIARRKN